MVFLSLHSRALKISEINLGWTDSHVVQIPSLWGALKIFHERFDALKYNEGAHWVIDIQPLSPKKSPVLPAGKVCETTAEILSRWFLTAGCIQKFYLREQGWGWGCPYIFVCSAAGALEAVIVWGWPFQSSVLSFFLLNNCLPFTTKCTGEEQLFRKSVFYP